MGIHRFVPPISLVLLASVGAAQPESGRQTSAVIAKFIANAPVLDPSLASAERQRIQVVFLPGIPGSRLENSHGKVIWGENRVHARDLALQDPRSGDMLKGTVLRAYEAYGLHRADVYGEALDDLEAVASSRYGGLVELGYDWRHDLGRIADQLDDALASLIDGGKRQLVLVGHSFGGVAARVSVVRFLRDREDPARGVQRGASARFRVWSEGLVAGTGPGTPHG
jgi:pimeloyl-ACP methyl ester carboxylesterase